MHIVDPVNGRLYYNVMGEISAQRSVRKTHYLQRHGLYNDFLKEDKAGER